MLLNLNRHIPPLLCSDSPLKRGGTKEIRTQGLKLDRVPMDLIQRFNKKFPFIVYKRNTPINSYETTYYTLCKSKQTRS